MDYSEKVIVLDTETTNSLDDPICYDVGFAVVDYTGKVYETFSFAVADIFLDKELMSYAYFAKALNWWAMLKQGIVNRIKATIAWQKAAAFIRELKEQIRALLI